MRPHAVIIIPRRERGIEEGGSPGRGPPREEGEEGKSEAEQVKQRERESRTGGERVEWITSGIGMTGLVFYSPHLGICIPHVNGLMIDAMECV